MIEDENSTGTNVPVESPRRAVELSVAGDAHLIDVRADHEWEAGRLPGARHVLLNDLPAVAAELGDGRPVLIYCRTGERSEFAAATLISAGIDARNVEGGLVAASQQGVELEPEGAYVAESGEAAAVLQARARTTGK